MGFTVYLLSAFFKFLQNEFVCHRTSQPPEVGTFAKCELGDWEETTGNHRFICDGADERYRFGTFASSFNYGK